MDGNKGTIVIATHQVSFILEPQMLSPRDPNYTLNQKCKMNVIVNEKVYTHETSKPHWYYIDYSYEYICNETGKTQKKSEPHRIPSNPFYGMKNATEEIDGTIILKNSMTEEMVKYLLMPLEELSKYTGSRCPQEYKKQVILSIANFW